MKRTDHDWLAQNLDRMKIARLQDPSIQDGTAIGARVYDRRTSELLVFATRN